MSKEHKKKVKEAEVVPNRPTGKYLMSILVLSVSLVKAITGTTPSTLSPEMGKQVIDFIDTAVKDTFPDIAPMIMGMFGLELMQLMPLLENPKEMIQDMVKQYTEAFTNVNQNPESNPK